MYVAFILSDTNWEGKLTKIFTDSYCYHVGFLSDDKKWFYDMHLVKRRSPWEGQYDSENVMLMQCPVKEEDLLDDIADSNADISSGSVWYGVLDYLMFAFRPLFHLLGKSTPNFTGIICSEWVNDMLISAGVQTGFDENEGPPSPADLLRFYCPAAPILPSKT